jgi:hypothetical protein
VPDEFNRDAGFKVVLNFLGLIRVLKAVFVLGKELGVEVLDEVDRLFNNVSRLTEERRYRALSAASAAKFNIAPIRWQHPLHVAIVPPESKGKTEENDWDTACGNFKTSISSIYHNKKCVCSFSLPK